MCYSFVYLLRLLDLLLHMAICLSFYSDLMHNVQYLLDKSNLEANMSEDRIQIFYFAVRNQNGLRVTSAARWYRLSPVYNQFYRLGFHISYNSVIEQHRWGNTDRMYVSRVHRDVYFYAQSSLIMSTFLIRSATFQSSSYPIFLTRLGGPRSRPNPHLRLVEVPGIEPASSWSVVRHANH